MAKIKGIHLSVERVTFWQDKHYMSKFALFTIYFKMPGRCRQRKAETFYQLSCTIELYVKPDLQRQKSEVKLYVWNPHLQSVFLVCENKSYQRALACSLCLTFEVLHNLQKFQLCNHWVLIICVLILIITVIFQRHYTCCRAYTTSYADWGIAVWAEFSKTTAGFMAELVCLYLLYGPSM